MRLSTVLSLVSALCWIVVVFRIWKRARAAQGGERG